MEALEFGWQLRLHPQACVAKVESPEPRARLLQQNRDRTFCAQASRLYNKNGPLHLWNVSMHTFTKFVCHTNAKATPMLVHQTKTKTTQYLIQCT